MIVCFAGCKHKDSALSDIFWYRKNIFHGFHSWAIFEFVYFNRFHQIVEHRNPVFNIFFWSFCNAKTVINVPFENFRPYQFWIMFGFSFRIFSRFARYKLAKVGATFVRIIMPKFCLKYLPLSSIRLYSKTFGIWNNVFVFKYYFYHWFNCMFNWNVRVRTRKIYCKKETGSTFPFSKTLRGLGYPLE